MQDRGFGPFAFCFFGAKSLAAPSARRFSARSSIRIFRARATASVSAVSTLPAPWGLSLACSARSLCRRLAEDGPSRSRTVRCTCRRGTPPRRRSSARSSSSCVHTINLSGFVEPIRPRIASVGVCPAPAPPSAPAARAVEGGPSIGSQFACANSSASSTAAPKAESSLSTQRGTTNLNFSPPRCLLIRALMSILCFVQV
mmetsp:Transcript_11805/g.27650  ORF Transcript_11805/g.27650 Transcript_11805/m.27650 type:complete len:200 (+) Transcript_11805:358-957(+)